MSSERETSNELSQITSPVEAMAHTGSKTDDDVNDSQNTSIEYDRDNHCTEVSARSGDGFNREEYRITPSTSPVDMAHNGSDENSFEGDIRWRYDQERFTDISKETEENKRSIRRIGLSVNNDGSVAALLKDIFGSAYYQLSIRRLFPLSSSTISEDVRLHNGRYRKEFKELKLIGKGGFREVKKVENEVDTQHYAVKMVKSGSITWEKFSKEVTILAKLTNTRSPRIVRYHTAWLEEKDPSEPDTAESDDRGSHSSKPLTKYVLYIQMELCGKTLSEWLLERNKKSQKYYPFNCVNRTTNIHILKQILEGISFVHEQGILHGDLKPANVFLTEPQLEVKIGDFGLATCQEDPVASIFARPPAPTGRRLTTKIGTYPYTAPEQHDGSVYDIEADMYSFGIIKYEMFLPYKSLTETKESIEVLRKDEVIQEKELISKWPEEAELIESLTKKNKKDRPSASDVLKKRAYSDHNQQTQLSQRDSLIIEKDKELEKVKEESYKELRKVKEDRDKELEKVKEERDQELEKVKADRDKELEKVKEERDKELEKVKEERDKELQKVKEERDKELQKVKEDRDKELQKVKEDRDKELEKLKEDRDKVKEERDKVEEDVDKDWWWWFA